MDTRILSIVTLLLALLLGRVRLHGIHAPFTLALVYAAIACDLEYPWTAAGGVIGCLLGTVSWSGATGTVLLAAATAILRLFYRRLSARFQKGLFATVLLLLVPLDIPYGTWEWLYGLLSVPIAFGTGFLLTRALQALHGIRTVRLLAEWDQNALLVLWGLCILACSDLKYGDVSLSVILILFTTMVLTRTRGMYGSFVASLLSAAWVLYAGADARIVAIATLGAALSIPFYREGRIWIVLSHFAAVLLLIGMQPEGLSPMLVWNTVAASLLLILLPDVLLKRIVTLTAIDKTMQKNARTSLLRAQKRTAATLTEMGALLREVSDTFEPEPEPQTAEEWTMQGALVICLNCEHQKTCRARPEDYRTTVLELAERLDNAEKVIPLDPLRPDCPSFADLCGSILLAYQQAMTRGAVLDRLQNESRFTARTFRGAGAAVDRLALQYRGTFGSDRVLEEAVLKALLREGYAAETVEARKTGLLRMVRVHFSAYDPASERPVLRCIAEAANHRVRLIRTEQHNDGVQMLLEPEPRWRVRMEVSQTALEECAPGDSYGELRSEGGRVLYALSDGMGSGKSAEEESRSAIGALFRLYDAGLERELVYENVNRILMHRSSGDAYATLDAVSVDLNEGTAELLKFGTPPSYLLRGKTLYTLTGEALPCGIVPDARPTVIRLTFSPGDILLLCTDGISDALQDRLEAVLLEHARQANGAERILGAAKATGYRDDQSVMLLRISG